MVSRFLLVLLLQVSFATLYAAEVKPGVMLGAKTAETPQWFKESFLDFEEDVAEAAADGKRVMIFFHQEGCPYCARMVEKSFNHPPIETYIREHFDGITINMWGDREVVSIGNRDFTEKTFSAALKVQYTPTLLFLDERGKTVLRLDGYYAPGKFLTALSYVAEHQETRVKFGQFMLDQQQTATAALINEDFFTRTDRLDRLIEQSGSALAVYFESGDCEDCQILHERILVDEPTRRLVKKMQNMQFDVRSEEKITLPNGQKSTVRQWARKLDIAYTPSVVFFDTNGIEVMRISAFLKTFHFQSVYDYVLQKAYLHEPSFQRYISERADKIREAGFDTNIWGYESSHK